MQSPVGSATNWLQRVVSTARRVPRLSWLALLIALPLAAAFELQALSRSLVAYAGKLAAGEAAAARMFDASVWAVVFVESGLLAVALWYGLAQRRRSEVRRARQRSLQQLAAVVDNAPVVAYAVDSDGVLTFLQGRALEEAGIKTEALIGHSFTELFGDREVILTAHQRALDGEDIHLRLDAFDRTWDVHGHLVLAPGASRPEVVGVAQDVTELVASQETLRESEERFRAVVQNSHDPVIVLDASLQPAYASPASATILGRPMSRNPLDDVFADDRERVVETIASIAAQPGATARVQMRLLHADGGLREVESVVYNALDVPAIGGIIVNTRDVSDVAQANALLATQARILTMIASGATLRDTLTAITAEVNHQLPEVRSTVQLLGVDGSLEITAAVSREDLACAHMEGMPASENTICGSALLRDRTMLVEDPAASNPWGSAPCLRGTTAVKECWVTPIRRDPNGEPVGVLSCYFASAYEPDDRARQVVQTACELAAVAIDRKRFEDRLSHQALHDQLTGLPNRALLVEQLRADVARAARTETTGAVLCIDLDRFKMVNDSLGHESGDHVLREMAQRISAEVRAEDTVARLGGDEFAVSCPDIRDDEESIRLAQRLLRTIAQPLTVRSHEVRLTASIGIAIRHAGNARVDMLLRNADVALYRAKEGGRDRWEMFDKSLRRRAVHRLRTETALRKAVDAGEFELWYQPVWSMARQRVRAVEALVRWPQPRGQIASPAAFIPLAEETGLISKLGAWVLGRACADGAVLDHDGICVERIAVNASARQLTDGSLVPAIQSALSRARWDPARLTIEVTESAIVADPAAALQTMKALRALDVTVALDDFGTGFSSMSYLKDFRYVDVIKIDRSFVSGLGNRDSADHAIVRATIALAEAVGARVVAEGVETAEQLAALLSLGCDMVQGYLVAQPMPLPDLRAAMVNEPWRPALLAAEQVPPILRMHAAS